MKNHRAKTIAIMLFTLIVLKAEALGLGDLVIHSKLGQPLQADIPIIQNSTAPILEDEIKTNIADQARHTRANIDSTYARQHIDFDLKRDQSDTLILKLSSRLPIKEPIINFLLDISWQTGRLIKEYVLLIDPPEYQVSPYEPSRRLNQQQGFKQTSIAASTSQYKEGKYGPIQAGETLFRIALNLRPKGKGISLEDMMNAILNINPKAFIKGRPEGLMQGSTLTIPTADEILSNRDSIKTLKASDSVSVKTDNKADEKTILDTVTETITETVQQTVASLSSLMFLNQKPDSLKFSTKIVPVNTGNQPAVSTVATPIHLSLQQELLTDSHDYIESLTVEEPTAEILEEEIIDETLAEEELIETEPPAEEPILDEIIPENEQETVLTLEDETEPQTFVDEPVETAATNDLSTEEIPDRESTSATSIIDKLKTRMPDLLLPVSILLTIILAILFWFFSRHARRNSSENVLYDSLEKAGSEEKPLKTPDKTEPSPTEEPAEKTQIINEEDQNEFITTTSMPPFQAEAREEPAEGTSVEEEAEEFAKKELDVDFPLSFEDTLGNDDIVIDEDDYEDLLDITTETSDADEEKKEQVKPEFENEEPLTLDIDVYAEPDPDDDLDPAVKEFEREVTVRMAYGDFKGAEEKIDQALESEPDNPRHKLLRLNLYKTSGQTTEALALATDLLSKAEELPEALRKEVEIINKDLRGGKLGVA